MGTVTLKKQAAASVTTPPTDYDSVFIDTDGVPKYKDESGVVHTFGGGGGHASAYATGYSGATTYSYIGSAAPSTATSAAGWTITRHTFDGAGALTATTHATTNPTSVFDNYASLTYT